jgi:hypothetical protein
MKQGRHGIPPLDSDDSGYASDRVSLMTDYESIPRLGVESSILLAVQRCWNDHFWSTIEV